jgi:sugar lactone lactonase YvrE
VSIRYDPDGKLERRIHDPGQTDFVIGFGSADLTDIFITTAGKSEPMPMMPPGSTPDSGCFGGRLYHINLGIKAKSSGRSISLE